MSTTKNVLSGTASGNDVLLSGVAAGALNATSTEAVNGSQLFATNQNVAANTANIATHTTSIAGNTTDIANLGGRVTTVEGSVTNLTNDLNNGLVGLVKQDATTKAITVAGDKAGTSVNFAGTEGARTLSGVKAGALNGTSTEVVNGSQLFATNENVAANTANIATNTTNIAGNTTDIANLGGRVTTAEGNITTIGDSVTNLTNDLNNGLVGLVKQDATTKAITVAGDKAGASVNFAGTEGARTLSGVKAGALNGTSTEAVNGSQLFATNENVAANTTNIANLDGRVTTVEGSVSDLTNNVSSGLVGLVKQDATTKAITVAGDKAGTSVNFAGTEGARTLSGVKAGALNGTSTEAVNGSQLFATNENVAANTTNIANLDGRVTIVEGSVTDLTNNVSNGSVGLVKQDATTKAITVAGDKAGTSVNFAGTEGARTLSGVKAGALNGTSTEAVNGSQLFATNENVATNTTNIAGNTTAIAGLDGRVTIVEGSVSDLTNNVSSGLVGLVKQDATTKAITVAGDKPGTSVSFAGTEGARTLSGVKAGALNETSTDAVNGSQLFATNEKLRKSGIIDANGNALDVLTYDAGSNKGSITLGGANGTQLKNVADGTENGDAVNLGQLKKGGLIDGNGNTNAVIYDADSNRTKVTFGDANVAQVLLSNVAAGTANTDAANVGQLRGVASALGGGAAVGADGSIVAPKYTVNNATYTSVGDALQGLAGTIDHNGSRLTVVEKLVGTTQASSHLATSGDVTQTAVASGDNAVAIGAGATASASNSVALGAGSTTGNRENTVSVGSAGNERAIANVADAVMSTDAVNKRQLDSVADSARAYTDQRMNQVQSDIARVKRDSNAAAAAAMAVATLPQSIQPGRSMASAAISNMDGESALAVGVSKVADNGRWVTKLSGTANTRGNVGVSAGIGFHW